VRKATRIVAASLGIFAGIGGAEHGYFEILQGHVKPEGLMIASLGPPCEPDKIWNACEPAMTVIPSFLVSGIVATLLGIITMIWAAAFVHKKRGGLILILLSVALLLTGGGIFPPVIGFVAGIIATKINKAFPKWAPGGLSAFLATLWPWPLVAFFVWMFGQFIIGHFFNDFLLSSGFLIPLFIIGLMALAIASASAYDRQQQMA